MNTVRLATAGAVVVWVFLSLPGRAQATMRDRAMVTAVEGMRHYRAGRDRVIEHTVAKVQEFFEVSVGYREDDLNWNIAGNTAGTNPNILSELTWEDLQSLQLKAKGAGTAYEHLYVRTLCAVGWILDGENQDSDYLSNNRTGESSRANNASDDGWTLDGSLGLGLQFRFLSDTLQVAPLGGYSIHWQRLTMTEGSQTLGGTLGPIHGLDSTYNAEWLGPWAGVDATYQPAPTFSLYGTLEYHWADYEAEANWNLRTDLAHPKSFKHIADGTGIVASAGLRYAMTDRLSLHASADFQDWSTDPGIDHTFLANGTTSETRLNEVNWNSIALMTSLSYQW